MAVTPYAASSSSPTLALHRKRRKSKYSASAFYTSILLICTLAFFGVVIRKATYSNLDNDYHLASLPSIHGDRLHSRSTVFGKQDEDCKLVHHAEDKCAFIRSNCPDEEAGLLSYLSLYYCRLPHAQPVAFIVLVLWLGLLFTTIGIAASDFFCVNLSTIASLLGMSESLAGVTFLAIGNGSPDVFSTFAAMSTHSGSLAVGELIGAASFITAVVVGSMAIVRPFKVARKSFVRDVGFFVVAACFSMYFLVDGSLHLWECGVMVGFYVFYVAFVMVWHWWLGRTRRRRERDSASRNHVYNPGHDDLEAPVEEEEEDTTAGERRSLLRHGSSEDFGALERGGATPELRPGSEDEDEDDEETRERYMAELSSNMRINRPPRGERRNTVTPIRPSLVGALEFRAVLSSLQKSRSIQSIPINLRRYSDDPYFTTAQQQDQVSQRSDPELISYEGAGDSNSLGAGPRFGEEQDRRGRAKSTNDVVNLHLDPNRFNRGVPQIDLSVATPPARQENFGYVDRRISSMAAPPSPSISLSPPPSQRGSRGSSPAAVPKRVPSPDMLAPPQQGYGGNQQHTSSPSNAPEGTPSNDASSRFKPPQLPKIQIPHAVNGPKSTTKGSPFPFYTESPATMSSRSHSRAPSLHLPPPSISPESTYPGGEHEEFESKPIRWWPYRLLPPPQIVASILFPTIYSWKNKSIWEKLLGIVAAPSVFLLSITLPVVESELSDDILDEAPESYYPPQSGPRQPQASINILPPESPSPLASTGEWAPYADEPSTPGAHARHELGPATAKGRNGHATDAVIPVSAEMHLDRPQLNSSPPSPPREWNRWLVGTQIVMAPIFVLLVVWANMPISHTWRSLLLPLLYTLVGSLFLLFLLLLTTSPSRSPRLRPLLCFAGFAVAIAWISTIANEVVGVLKALGVICGISDAILGLTVFAVGNSLGDLVADITVARLGYQVMALSAAFAGPLLNILLGIGISGLIIMVRAGTSRHERHPDRELRFKPYQIEVSSTLMISAATLVLTLLGLLIVVPLNNWRMDRRVGWGLVILWCLSTVGNLVVEATGWGGKVS